MKIAGLCLLPQAREPSLHPTAEARWVLRVLRLSRFYKIAVLINLSPTKSV